MTTPEPTSRNLFHLLRKSFMALIFRNRGTARPGSPESRRPNEPGQVGASPPAPAWKLPSLSHGGLITLLLVCLLGVVGLIWSVPATESADLPAPVAQLAPVASDAGSVEQRLAESARFLASDKMEGRGVDTAGLDAAADYIADQFRQAGLKTDLYGESPFQSFHLSKRFRLGPTNRATLRGRDGVEIELKVGADFRPLSLSGSGDFDLPLVFVGYGITAEEHGYDDYAGVDVAGKAVVVLRHEPEQGDPNSAFNGTSISRYALLVNKVRTAESHGAAAVLFCTDLYHLQSQSPQFGNEGEVVEGASRSAGAAAGATDPLLGFEVEGDLPKQRVPVFHCRREIIDRVVQSSAGAGLAELERQIEEGPTPRSRELDGWTIAGTVSVDLQGRRLKNVVGVLDGEGPRSEETLVIGAHYDHLGWGEAGSLSLEQQIHNGADDNASGTAVLIEIARQLTALRDRLPRRVVFIAFTAEERGLVGSQHYVADPLVPLNQTVAMLNLDMVGRLRSNRLTVSGTGTAPGFSDLLERTAAKYGLAVVADPGGHGPSDHASFYARGIPVLHFFTGLHDDYHTPGDDVEKLNVPGMRRIGQMVAAVAIEIAVSDYKPRREPTYLGVWRDEDYQGTGYAVLRVTEGTPAERAGFAAGDVIVRIGERPVTQWQDLLRALESHQPGQLVVVAVRRGNVEVLRPVTLGRRGSS